LRPSGGPGYAVANAVGRREQGGERRPLVAAPREDRAVTSVPCRRFTISDAILLVAATAVGLSQVRGILGDLGTFHWGNRKWALWDYSRTLIGVAVPILAAWTTPRRKPVASPGSRPTCPRSGNPDERGTTWDRMADRAMTSSRRLGDR
jgi:hypothetical protein